jgi:hypothetical protein
MLLGLVAGDLPRKGEKGRITRMWHAPADQELFAVAAMIQPHFRQGVWADDNVLRYR